MVPDAVVVGAGPNGLVAANVLADAGWSVTVLEANDEPGGAVRSGEVTAAGFISDLSSAFYPIAFLSPALRSLDLEAHGLRWVRAPAVVAHPTRGATAVLERDVDATAASVERFAAGDGDAWRRFYALWERAGRAFADVVLSPVPPARHAAALARALGLSRLLPFGRVALQSVRALAEERFAGEGARLLVAGNALHADIPPEGAGSALFSFVLCGAGQDVGYPVPEGGAGRLTAALVDRLRARGGVLRCGARVAAVEVRGGRAVSVRTVGGEVVAAGRAVLADVDAVRLYTGLVADEHLPAGFGAALARRLQRAPATFKLDWALSGPIPWSDPSTGRGGAVHIADSLDEMTLTSAQLAAGVVPDRPFLLFGQLTTTDPSRSPAGTEVAWCYTHVPHVVHSDAGGSIRGVWDDADVEAMTERVEARIEAHAPGFRDLIVGRHVQSPPALEAANANLVGGDLSGGSSALHQQLVFRPTIGLARPETPIRGLYLASSSAHPGNAVHGAPGANAAIAALAAANPWQRPIQAAVGAAARRITARTPLDV